MKLKEKKPSFLHTIMPLKKLADKNEITLLQLYLDIMPPEYKRAELIPEVLEIIADDVPEEYTEEEVANTILGFIATLDFEQRREMVNSTFGLKDQEKVLQGALVEVLKSESGLQGKKSD